MRQLLLFPWLRRLRFGGDFFGSTRTRKVSGRHARTFEGPGVQRLLVGESSLAGPRLYVPSPRLLVRGVWSQLFSFRTVLGVEQRGVL